MSIASVNYPQPVMVNGFLCKNCTEVDLAKAHVDPQHPGAGPFGVNAKADPSLAGKNYDAKTGAVTFGGSLAEPNDAGTPSAPSSPRGRQVDLSV